MQYLDNSKYHIRKKIGLTTKVATTVSQITYLYDISILFPTNFNI